MKDLFENVYKNSKVCLFEELDKRIAEEQKTFLITANPEIFMSAQQNRKIHDMLVDKDNIVTADGEGIVKAAAMLDMNVTEKIAGVDTVEHLIKYAHKHGRSLYVYGSSQVVLDAFSNKLATKYANVNVLSLKNGYDNKDDEILNDMLEKQPDIVLVALGVPRQELLILNTIEQFQKGVFVGVGGSIDVLSGFKKRAPKVFITCKLEWFYRIIKEPKRIKRFYQNNVKFIMRISRIAKEK